MKPKPIIALLLLLACFACGKKNVPPPEEDVLYRVECIYQHNFDSAVRILDTLDPSVLSMEEQAHYCLLKAIFIGNTKRFDAEFDSLLQVAKKYYIGCDDKYHEAWTYWLIGNKTTNMQQPQEIALDAMLKARNSIESCRHVDERLVKFSLKPTDEQAVIDDSKYFILLELGMIYGASVYVADAIPTLKLADAYFAKIGDHYNRLSSAYMLGLAYLSIEEFDSCLMHFQDGLQAAQALGDPNECGSFHHNFAFYYNYCVERNHYETEEERQQLLDKAVMEAKEGLAGLVDTTDYKYGYDKQLLLESLANSFFLMQQYDSCIYYGEQAIEVARSNDRLFESYNHYKELYESYKALGDEKNAVVYAEHVLTMEHPETHMKDVVKVQEEYDKQMELQRVQGEQQVRRYRLYLWIGVLLLVLLAVLWLTFRYRKNKELETLRLQEENLRMQSANDRMTHEASENLMRRVSYIYRSHEDDAYRHILAEFNSVYPKTISNLKADHPDLTDAEIGVCLLSFLSFRVKEIGVILGFKENTISKYRAYIRSKTGIEEVGDVLKGYVGTANEEKGAGQGMKN